MKKLYVPTSSQMISPLFMQFRMTIVFDSSWAFNTSIYVRSFSTSITTRHLQFTTVCPQGGVINFSQCVVSSSWWSNHLVHVRDSKCAPRDSFYHSPFFGQVLQRLSTRISTSPLQPLCVPTTCHIHPFIPQTVSQGITHLPPSHIQKTPYQGFGSSEVHVLSLRFRLGFVRQDLVCVHRFENHESTPTRGGQWDPVSVFSKVTHDTSHPSLSSSNRVSRTRAFTPQTHTENTLSGILTVRGSCSTTSTESYGFDLSDRIWGVSIVMTLVVDCLLGCVYPTILTGPPYIPFCLYHLPKRHMMCAHF
jgi:hypothetical protein